MRILLLSLLLLAITAQAAFEIPTIDSIRQDYQNMLGEGAYGVQSKYRVINQGVDNAIQANLGASLENKNNWDTAFSWGNHALAGYLETESDPNFSASVASSITQNNKNSWNDAYISSVQVGTITKTIYVDKNRTDSYTENGSITKPFKTLVAALAVATNGTLIKLQGGIYNENITIPDGVSIEGTGINSTALNGNVNTTASTPIGLRFLQIGSGKTLTLNCPTSMIDTYTSGAVVVNNVVVQAYNSHIVSPTAGLVPLTVNGSSAKYQSVLASIASTGDTNAVDLNDGTLILNTVSVSGSSATNTMLNSTDGQAVLLNSYVMNLGGGAAANIDNGATTAPNMLNGVFAIGNFATGTAYTVIEGINISGTLSGSNIIYRPASRVANDSTVVGSTVKDALNTLNENNNFIMERKLKVYVQTAEPTLANDYDTCIWVDSDDSNRTYLVFRRGAGDQISVEMN